MGWGKYPWLLGKLLALAFIFVGGGMLAAAMIMVTPLLADKRGIRVRLSIHRIFRFYLGMLQRSQMIAFRVEGERQLIESGGKIVIANHPCLLDVVALMAIIPHTQCIVKHELWNHWFLGRLMRAAGFIRNDLPPAMLIEECRKALAQGRSLIIFPEGTRTKLGQMVHFHRGFANIATLTGAPIQTVVIACTPIMLYKGEPWWNVPAAKPVLRVSAGICMNEQFYAQFAERSIACRRVMEHLENYYCENTEHG